jgi:Sulfotransferase domain
MGPDIIIVSGLPRSGTSLMMQMLDGGGVDVVTDGVRAADTDNPRGYHEFERVKRIKKDASWLPSARGKAVKMISQLLYDLPSGESYRILFMDRDLDEILRSQEKMLERLGRPAAPREQMTSAYALHLEKLHHWLRRQPNMAVLRVSYNGLVAEPRPQAERVSQFLGGAADVEGMVPAVDPALYRNRKDGAARPGLPVPGTSP